MDGHVLIRLYKLSFFLLLILSVFSLFYTASRIQHMAFGELFAFGSSYDRWTTERLKNEAIDMVVQHDFMSSLASTS